MVDCQEFPCESAPSPEQKRFFFLPQVCLNGLTPKNKQMIEKSLLRPQDSFQSLKYGCLVLILALVSSALGSGFGMTSTAGVFNHGIIGVFPLFCLSSFSTLCA